MQKTAGSSLCITLSELLQMMQERPEEVMLTVEIEQGEGEEDGREIQTR